MLHDDLELMAIAASRLRSSRYLLLTCIFPLGHFGLKVVLVSLHLQAKVPRNAAGSFSGLCQRLRLHVGRQLIKVTA